MAKIFCPDCGNQIGERFAFCQFCGAKLNSTVRSRKYRNRNSMAGVVAGICSCVLAIFGIFAIGFILVPLAALFGLFGLIGGISGRSGSGVLVSVVGLIFTAVGFVSSPVLLAMTGFLLVTSVSPTQTSTDAMSTKPIPEKESVPTDKALVFGMNDVQGEWAKSKSDCLNQDGPSSKTIIDFSNQISGKMTPLFDQYENHCVIIKRETSDQNTTLDLNCYEFWEDFSKGINSRKTVVRLSTPKIGELTINGISYQRCTKTSGSR